MDHLTREQRYARDVHKCVASYEKQTKEFQEAYGSLAHKLPILIHSAGLAQAIAFVEARHKPDSPQRQLLRDLEQVLGEAGLAARSRMAPLPEYMQLTQRALAALLWFKRYAQSVLNVTGEQSTEASHG